MTTRWKITHTESHAHAHELFKTSFWNTIGKICAFFVVFFWQLLSQFCSNIYAHISLTQTRTWFAHCHYCTMHVCVCVYVVAENIVQINFLVRTFLLVASCLLFAFIS